MSRFALIILFVVINCELSSAQEWRPLFDGLSFAGWMQVDGRPVDAPAWQVADGMMHLDRRLGKGGSLLSNEVFGDFELVFEWKLAKGANNGIKYRVNDFDGRKLGIEYQMIDDFEKQELKPRYRTASLYDIYAPREHGVLRPAGEFNRGRILVHNNRIEHWLNGHLVTEALVGSKAWNERISKSKFHDVEGFGVVPTGRIMLTDHNDEVWYRNVFIRRLDVQPVGAWAATGVVSRCRCLPVHRCVRRRPWLFGRR